MICGFESHLVYLPLLTLVFDSPPLQALHRCGVLGRLITAHRVVTPKSVALETARSRDVEGGDRVPDLSEHPDLAVHTVADDLLSSTGAVLIGEARATTQHRLDAHKIDRPELEVVLLARELHAFAVVEDKAALRVASKLAVRVVGVAELLCDLEVRGVLVDAVDAAKAIRATRYHTRDLVLLASGTRRPAWKGGLA